MRVATGAMMAAVVALVQAAAPMPPRQPTPGGSISLSYTLTILAIPFGHIDYAARFEGARYEAQMHFRTGGLAAVLWKAQIDGDAHGRIASGALLPESYRAQSLSRSGAGRTVRVEYSGNGLPLAAQDPPDDLSREPVTEAQKEGTVDPLTAITSVVAGLNGSPPQPCGKTLSVFDGRRRYDIVFTLVPDTGSGAAAHSRLCKAEYRHIAGPRQDVVAVSSVPAMDATLVETSSGPRSYTFARTIRSAFLWGAVTARLDEAKLDGRPLPPAP